MTPAQNIPTEAKLSLPQSDVAEESAEVEFRLSSVWEKNRKHLDIARNDLQSKFNSFHLAHNNF